MTLDPEKIVDNEWVVSRSLISRLKHLLVQDLPVLSLPASVTDMHIEGTTRLKQSSKPNSMHGANCSGESSRHIVDFA